MILAGDIGGTSTRLAVFEPRDGQLVASVEETFPSREFDGLASIATRFVERHRPSIRCAAFGIAGPVQDGVVKTPNLPWTIESAALARVLALPQVDLINDLEANAWGIGALAADDVEVLQPGRDNSSGNRAVVSAGTGLGMAGLYWDGRVHRPFASEGGHADWAPRSSVEVELLAYAQQRWPRVSIERVLSGPAFALIYAFFRDTGRFPERAAIVDQMRTQDPAAVITRAALAGDCPLCVATLDQFVAIYGAVAGNVALTMMATGGLYIGGGIAPRIAAKLHSPTFLEAFLDKGRLRPLVEATPVRVILNPKTALLGAACYAAARLD